MNNNELSQHQNQEVQNSPPGDESLQQDGLDGPRVSILHQPGKGNTNMESAFADNASVPFNLSQDQPTQVPRTVIVKEIESRPSLRDNRVAGKESQIKGNFPNKQMHLQSSYSFNPTPLKMQSKADASKKEPRARGDANQGPNDQRSRSNIAPSNLVQQQQKYQLTQKVLGFDYPRSSKVSHEQNHQGRSAEGSLRNSRPSLRFNTGENSKNRTEARINNESQRRLSTESMSKQMSLEAWTVEESHVRPQPNVKLPDITANTGPRVNEHNQTGNFGQLNPHFTERQATLQKPSMTKSKSVQRIDLKRDKSQPSSGIKDTSAIKSSFYLGSSQMLSSQKLFQYDKFKIQSLESGQETLKTLLGPTLPQPVSQKRNDVTIMSARLQQARQSQLSKIGEHHSQTTYADLTARSNTKSMLLPKEEQHRIKKVEGNFNLSFKADKLFKRPQFLDKMAKDQSKLASKRPFLARNASEMLKSGILTPNEDPSRLGGTRHVHEYKERHEMTKKMRQGKNKWETSVPINGPMTKFVDDGSSQSRTSEMRYRALMREQLFEQEVRMQLKQKLRIFSKEMQCLLKRGIDYITPLETIANIQTNSMRKEQLRQEYVNYVKMVLKDRFHEYEDESPKSNNNVFNFDLSKQQRDSQLNQEERTTIMQESIIGGESAPEEYAKVLNPLFQNLVSEFVISLKGIFEGSETQMGILQEHFLLLDKYWFQLQKHADLKDKEPTSYAVRIQKYRDSAAEKEDYFISEEYMQSVMRSMDMIDYQRLYTRSGFTEVFLREYWQTHDQLLSKVKKKIQGCLKGQPKQEGAKGQRNTQEEACQFVILLLSQSFYVLRSALALRLDSLFKFEDHKHKSEIGALKKHYVDKLSLLEEQVQRLQSQRDDKQKQMERRIEELQEQLYNAKLERDYIQNDLRTSRSFAQKLKEQLVYFTYDYQLDNVFQTNYDSHNVDELGIRNKKALHMQQRKFGEEVIHDMLVRLDSYIKEIDNCKVSSVQMAQKMNRILDSALGNDGKDDSSSYGLRKSTTFKSLKPEAVFNKYMPSTVQRSVADPSRRASSRDILFGTKATKGVQVNLPINESKLRTPMMATTQFNTQIVSNPVESQHSRYISKHSRNKSNFQLNNSIEEVEEEGPGVDGRLTQPAFSQERLMSKTNYIKDSIKQNETATVGKPASSIVKDNQTRELQKKFSVQIEHGEPKAESQLAQSVKAKVNLDIFTGDLTNRKRKSQKTRQRITSSIQASSVKGWRGEEASPDKPSVSSFEEVQKQKLQEAESYDSNEDSDSDNESSESANNHDLEDLNILMQNDQLKNMIEGPKQKQKSNTENTENLKMILKNETANNQITLQMTRQKLLGIIDDLFNRRLDSILEHSNAYKGVEGSTNMALKANTQKELPSIILSSQISDQAIKEKQSVTLVEFIFNYYLRQYEIKSMAIKQLNSIIIGLIKYFEKNKEENFYLFFLLRLFDFDEQVLNVKTKDADKLKNHLGWKPPQFLSLKERNQNKLKEQLEEMKGKPNIWDRWANQKASLSDSSQQSSQDYSKFTFEQQTIVLWSRKVFTFAQERFLSESQKKLRSIQKRDKKSKQQEPDFAQKAEFDYKSFNKAYHEKNGGILGLNFLFKVLHRSLFGRGVHGTNDSQSQKDSVHYPAGSFDVNFNRFGADQTRGDNSLSKSKGLIAYGAKDADFHETHQLFVEMIINLQIEDTMLYDMHSATMHEQKKVGLTEEPDSLPYKPFDEYDLNYKLFSEAKFLLWKLLAIIKYSLLNLKDIPVSKTQASIASSNLRDGSEQRSVHKSPNQSNSPAKERSGQRSPQKQELKKQSTLRKSSHRHEQHQALLNEIAPVSKIMDEKGKNKSIDLIFLIDYLEKKYLSKYRKKKVSKGSNAGASQDQTDANPLLGAMQQNTKIFKQSQIEVLKNFLGHMGLKDIRMVKIKEIEKLIAQHVDHQNYLFPNFQKNLHPAVNEKMFTTKFDQTRELHVMSYTQFCKMCLSQQKLIVQDQIQNLHRIFYEADDNQDGVLTLQEFWGLLINLEADNSKKSHAYSNSISSIPNNTDANDDFTPTAEVELSSQPGNVVVVNQSQHGRQSSLVKSTGHTGISKERAIQLFNEALDFSNAERQEEKMKEMQRQMLIIEQNQGASLKERKNSKKKQQKLEEAKNSLEEIEKKDIGSLDKITAQGFTRMILKNKVGGFSIGKIFSDLRYTLQT